MVDKKVRPLPNSKADEEKNLQETKNIFKASKKIIKGSDAAEWAKIAKAARENIK